MNVSPRFTAVFRWINTHMGWWAFALALLAVLLAVLSVQGDAGAYASCSTTSTFYAPEECPQAARWEALEEVSLMGSPAVAVVFAALAIQALRNHLSLRRDRLDQTPRWEAIKDQYSRGGHDALEDMDGVRLLRDGDEPHTHAWLAGRTAVAVGLALVIACGLVGALFAFFAAEPCPGDFEDERGCSAYGAVYTSAATGFLIAAAAGIACLVFGAAAWMAGRTARQGLLEGLEARERQALERLRSKA